MKQSAYKDAGVDIDAGAELVERIKPAVKRTARSGMMGGLGGFGAMFDPKAAGYHDPILVSSTDGVGTKIKIAIDANRHETIGIDLVAMCVNDLIVQGAEPLFFLDYFATGKLQVGVAQSLIEGIAKGCEMAGCALIGGETAEMPGMYGEGDYDLAGFTVGAVERGQVLTGEGVAEGDIVLGLASSGVHSNGYSLVRKLFAASGMTYNDPAPFETGKNMGDVLLAPTRIYVKAILRTLRTARAEYKDCPDGGLKALAHITGGGLSENIPRVLPENVAVRIDAQTWSRPGIFGWLAKAGTMDAADMARTFNCGLGMVLVVKADMAGRIAEILKDEGEKVFTIGSVVAREGSGPQVIIDNDQALLS